jgi:hypothetical protein
MKTLQLATVRCGCVALVASLLLLVPAWDAPRRATATTLGTCSQTEQRYGSDEAPQRCDFSDDCKDCSYDCTYVDGEYKNYTDYIYVGDCESAVCPYTARCVYCNGSLGCAVIKSYALQGDCEADLYGTTGYSYRSYKCTDTEGG